MHLQEATLAYIDMLRTLDPPIRPTTAWQDIAPLLKGDPRFEDLDVRQRHQLFDSHINGLLQVQALALEDARVQYQVRGLDCCHQAMRYVSAVHWMKYFLVGIILSFMLHGLKVKRQNAGMDLPDCNPWPPHLPAPMLCRLSRQASNDYRIIRMTS